METVKRIKRNCNNFVNKYSKIRKKRKTREYEVWYCLPGQNEHHRVRFD